MCSHRRSGSVSTTSRRTARKVVTESRSTVRRGSGTSSSGSVTSRSQGSQPSISKDRLHRRAVATDHDRVEPPRLRGEHAHGHVGRRLQRDPDLSLATTGEALLGPPAGRAAAVHLPAAHLRGHQPGAFEDTRGVPAEPHEQHADPTVGEDVIDDPAVRCLGTRPGSRGREWREGRQQPCPRPVLGRDLDGVVGRHPRRRAVTCFEALQPALDPLGRHDHPSWLLWRWHRAIVAAAVIWLLRSLPSSTWCRRTRCCSSWRRASR